MLTPREAAQTLGVQSRTIRRMAETYETVFGELPRVRPDEDRSPRLWPTEAVRRVQVAHFALKSGRVASLEHALTLVRDGAELPAGTEHEGGQEAVNLSAQLAELKVLLEAQGRELAHLRALVQDRARELPSTVAPALEGGDEVRRAVREEVQAALDPERLRIALHAAAPTPRRRSGWRGLLAVLLSWH